MSTSLFRVFSAILLATLFLSADARPISRRSCKAPQPSSSSSPSPSSSSSSAAPAPTSSASSGTQAVGAAPGAASSFSSNSAHGSCFPAVGFKMPSNAPASADNWWCDESSEYAFMGFSYEVTACQSPQQLQQDFADIRNTFNGRYIRMYGACDNDGFYDDVVNAAWDNGIGVHALIWFGFDGGNQWQQRRDSLVSTLYSNPKAKFVTRGIQFGSEPLFDGVLSPDDLASQIWNLKGQVKSLGIPVTVSELAYGYQENGGAQNVLDAQDYLNIHMLPFFDASASTSNDAWPIVQENLQFFQKNGGGKKMYFDENGWPSVTSEGVQPNSGAAVADVTNEAGYYQLLEDHCSDLKNNAQGGIGWFAHIYSDSQEPGYGIYDTNGNKKFNFAPRTYC